jgi:hypothetical protein
MRDNPCTARLNFCNVSHERNCACVNEQFFLTVLVVYGMQAIGSGVWFYVHLLGGNPVVKGRGSIMTRERERTIAYRSEMDIENS